jgi:hypothetical protein
LQLETERANREEIATQLSKLTKILLRPLQLARNQYSLNVAIILSKLQGRRKKSKTDLANLEVVLKILES